MNEWFIVSDISWQSHTTARQENGQDVSNIQEGRPVLPANDRLVNLTSTLKNQLEHIFTSILMESAEQNVDYDKTRGMERMKTM